MGNNLNVVQNKIKETASKATKDLNFSAQFGKDFQKSVELGLAHSLGAISVGANPLTSLPHELIRNVSIGLFHTLLSTFKKTGEAAKEAAAGIDVAAASINNLGEEGQEVPQLLAGIGKQASALGAIFAAIKPQLADFGIGIGLLLVGKVLDALGDSFIELSKTLVKASADASLAFTQLNATIDATGESLGRNLGSAEEWSKTIKDLSVQSGRSQKDLAEFALAFTQVGAEAGLGGAELTKLVEITAFTADRFRNSTEQLTNFRQALAGNTRFLANNIPIGNTIADVTERVTRNFVAQGKSQAEAAAEVAKLSTAQKVLLALQEASAPIIDVAKNATGSFNIEVRKLQGAIENLKTSFGAGLEGIFASFTKLTREVVQSLDSLPAPIKAAISLFIGLSGVVLEVAGKLFQLVGVITLVTAAVITLNALLATSFVGLGGTLGAYIAQFLGLGKSITNVTELFKGLKTAGVREFALLTGATTAFKIATTETTAATASASKVAQTLSSQFKNLGATTAVSAAALASTSKITGTLSAQYKILRDTVAKKDSIIPIASLISASKITDLLVTQFKSLGSTIAKVSPQLATAAASTAALASSSKIAQLLSAQFKTLGANAAEAAPEIASISTNISKFGRILNAIKGFSLKELLNVSVSTAISASFEAIKTALSGLYAILPGVISRVKSLFLTFGLPILRGVGIFLLIEGFEKFNEKLEITKNLGEIVGRIFSSLGALFDPLLNAIGGLNSSIPTIVKNMFAWESAVNLVAIGLSVLVLGVTALLAVLFKGIGLLAGFLAKLLSYIPGFSGMSKAMQSIADEADAVGEAFFDASLKTTRAIEDMIQEIEDLGKVTDKEFAKLIKGLQSLNQFKGGVVPLSSEGVKEYEKALKKLGEELEDVKAKGKSIEGGFIGELAAEATVKFNREAKALIEDRKKTAEQGLAIAEAGFKAESEAILKLNKLKDESRSKKLSIVDQNNLDAAIARAHQFKAVIESASKIAISPSISDKERKELAVVIDGIFGEKLANKIVETQRKAFENASNKVADLGHSISETIKLREESLSIEKDIEKTLNDTTRPIALNIENAKRQEVIKREELKIDKEIDKVLADIAKSENLGKLDLNVPIAELKELQGITRDGLGNLKVGIPKAELANLIATLEDLRAQKTNINFVVNRDEVQKQINDFIIKTGQSIQSLVDKFKGEFIIGNEQIKLANQYNTDLQVSVEYADRRKALKEKELEIDREILKIQIEIEGKQNFPLEDKAALEERLKVLRLLKADVLANFNSKQIVDATVEVNKALKQTQVELQDQIELLETRAKLFEERVLTGSFDKSQERVDILKGSLESLTKTLIELKRRQENEGLEIIPQSVVDETEARIEEIKRALKAANFINDIRELLQTIPDAIGQALDEGVRGVLAGTLKISELFKNMAQNILLSLSKIFANRALEGIGKQLGSLAETIAKSDIGRKIAAALGIPDVDKAFEKFKSPTEKLNLSVEKNTLAEDRNTLALDRNTAAHGGQTGGTPGTTPTNNGVPLPTGVALPPIDFAKVAQQITDGTATLEVVSEQEFSKLWQDITGQVQFGIQGIGDALQNVNNVMPDIKTLEENLTLPNFEEITQQLQNGFKLVSDTTMSGFKQTFETISVSIEDGFRSKITELTQSFDGVISESGLFTGLDADITSIFDDISLATDSGITEFTDSFSKSISSGIEGCFGTAEQSFGGFFSNIGSLLQSGLSSLTEGLGSLFSGGGDILSSIFGSIGGLFGFAKGGVIAGTPSTKDNRIIPAATGEGVTNAKATAYYGGKGFIDAINNMELPNFLGGLQEASAPSQFAGVASQATGSIPKQTRVGGGVSSERPIMVTVINKGPVVDPSHFKMKPSEVTDIVVNGIKKDRAMRRVINENAQTSKGGF